MPPALNPSHPIRLIGPGLPQKAGVSLFVAATARKLSEGREGVSFLTRFVARPDRTASHPLIRRMCCLDAGNVR
jgi:hypothetical protein